MGERYSFDCDEIHFVMSQIQFSADKFIEEARGDTTIYTSDTTLTDSIISKNNKYYFYTLEYNFRSTIIKSWFVDNNTLVICDNNSLCFESECDVYTWKIENGKLFLQNDRREYIFTREDLFEKIKNSVKPDTAK
jgi:hypothetical protein